MVDVAIARNETALLDLPHVAIVFDLELGLTTALGPFDDPITACVCAERFVDQVSGGIDRDSLTVEVVPLEGGEELVEPERRWHPRPA